MPIHLIKLIERHEVAKGTLVFTFEKPAGLLFKPGQYAGFTLINPAETDAGGVTRRFSLISLPDDPTLSIVTRMQNSAYKRVLQALPLGSEVKFAGPTGNFTLHEEMTQPAVLLAGGIGIAPFYSMIRFATKQHSPQSLYLFYGNRERSEAAFLSELEQQQQQNLHFKLIATLDKPDHTWPGETGLITYHLLKKYLTDLFTPIYYICGSPTMVTALQEMLAEAGVDEARIRTEDFPGY